VIVCERRGRLAARLRHALAERGLQVRVSETRNGRDCLAALRARRSSAIAVEMAPSPAAALELIDEVRRFNSSVLVTAVVDQHDGWVEPLTREFGAVYCAVDPYDLDRLVALIVRHLEQQRVGPAVVEPGQARAEVSQCR
jgi:DNA-binding NtrC family response regulator